VDTFEVMSRVSDDAVAKLYREEPCLSLITRIGIVFTIAAFVASCGATPPEQGPARPAPKTIVFVHGAWGGGWQYTKVEPLIEKAGHTVYRPTMTGLGERVHLGGPAVGLSTHIEDIVKVLETATAAW
jgi:hypothetical protein